MPWVSLSIDYFFLNTTILHQKQSKTMHDRIMLAAALWLPLHEYGTYSCVSTLPLTVCPCPLVSTSLAPGDSWYWSLPVGQEHVTSEGWLMLSEVLVLMAGGRVSIDSDSLITACMCADCCLLSLFKISNIYRRITVYIQIISKILVM